MKEPIRKIKTFNYLQWKFICLLYETKIEIYTSHKLQLIQTLKFQNSKIVNCYLINSKKTIVVLLEKYFVFFSFVFTRFASVKFTH